MNKAYSRINWENEPSTNTPINDVNLNAMDEAINTIDNRVVEQDGKITTLTGYQLKAEGYAVGTQNGSPVGSSSEYYHNNAKYYSDHAMSATPEGYSQLVDKVNAGFEVNEFTIPANSWIAFAGNDKYTKASTIATNKYSADFIPQYIDIIPAGNFFTDNEESAKALLAQTVLFDSNGFTVYASDVPATDLHIRIGGAK